MTASYPSSIPDYTGEVGGPGDTLDTPDHSSHHSNIADDVEAIATELGTNASTFAATVRDALDSHGSRHDVGGADEMAHVADTTNPHSVTAAQASAVALADIEDSGATFSGDGTTTTFTVSHSLGSAPNVVFVQATSADANAAKHVTNKTSTGFDVVFATAPASGTDNVTLDYHARL